MIFKRGSPQSLSSCSDSPISKETQERVKKIAFERRPPTKPDQEFEFFGTFKDNQVQICSAEDIFSQGKLLPFQSPSPSPSPSLNNTTSKKQGQVWNPLRKEFFHAKGRAMSHTNSAEYQRLENCRSAARSLETQLAKRASGGLSGPIGSKPKWYLLLFGTLWAPAEMVMSDIRSRQQRLNPTTVLPEAAGDEGKRRWSFLKGLSCRK